VVQIHPSQGQTKLSCLTSSRPGHLLPFLPFSPLTPKFEFLLSKLLMDVQVAWTRKLHHGSKRSEPKAGVWPSAAEDARRLDALDAQPGNLHRGEKYRAHGLTSLAHPAERGLLGV
jgi:hypothetical protein